MFLCAYDGMRISSRLLDSKVLVEWSVHVACQGSEDPHEVSDAESTCRVAGTVSGGFGREVKITSRKPSTRFKLSHDVLLLPSQGNFADWYFAYTTTIKLVREADAWLKVVKRQIGFASSRVFS